MDFFTSGGGSDVSSITRNLLFGTDGMTILVSINFEGFWKIPIFSWFFRSITFEVRLFFYQKKSEIFTVSKIAFS